ncbi:peptide-methionine (S)-S-oxide reductase MsrA [Xanthobacter variabilis]|uniref:peptide-methionine (S)-S-oxide reductase MsrA n=1 Tax=Xanthobacter variabilis TaxID=3119932 RepID=UPI00374F7C65
MTARRGFLLGLAAVCLVGASVPGAAQEGIAVPPPALDETATAPSEVAVLAGGCFWGVQGVFQHVKGVTSAVSGYAGGEGATARYGMVSSGATGHAESVKVTFDPRQISYGEILRIYFSVAHDPTQLNRQGPDHGTQYRSAIFPMDDQQARIAKAYIAQLDGTRIYDAAIATRIEPGHAFSPAEAAHQDFLTRNPGNPYIVVNDLPKIRNLARLYPDRYRAAPVLVGQSGH